MTGPSRVALGVILFALLVGCGVAAVEFVQRFDIERKEGLLEATDKIYIVTSTVDRQNTTRYVAANSFGNAELYYTRQIEADSPGMLFNIVSIAVYDKELITSETRVVPPEPPPPPEPPEEPPQ